MTDGRGKGRGAQENTPNRFARHHLEPIDIELPPDDELPPVRTQYFRDTSRTILARNDSPDISFTYSLNPYRGCEHGCIYCYARPSHEYLGFSAGLDFESRIMVKPDAAKLLRETLAARSWIPQMVALSGNTDCYQPVERTLELTRACLEVFLDFRNPVGIVTKNGMILRDIDLLRELNAHGAVRVMMSITTLDPDLCRKLEPRASTISKRLEAIRTFADAGIPVGVNASPIIPGLTDEELPAILEAAAGHGATWAGYTLVRLPGAVRPLFTDWLKRELPGKGGRILHRIRETRSGDLDDDRFGTRMRGTGEVARTIQALFDVHAAKYHLDRGWESLSADDFRRPGNPQLGLFDSPAF